MDYDIDYNNLPKHIAIIMDGNRRWAKQRGQEAKLGHKKGAETLEKLAHFANRIGIKYLTVYAFSTENWKRTEEEISALMFLLERYLEDFTKRADMDNIKVNVIGDITRLNEKLQNKIKEIISKTETNTGLTINIAFNYGGRAEIVNTTKIIANAVKNGEIDIEDITEETISNNLYTQGQPDPDLLIRTGGEIRTSNFLPWQIVYSEFYFTDKYWPDFGEEELIEAIKVYQTRNRRFGADKATVKAEEKVEGEIIVNVKRWVSGLLGFPLIAALLIFGNVYVVDIALAIFAIIALNEYFNCFKGKAKTIVEIGYLSTLLIAGMHVLKPEVWIIALPVILLLLFLKVVLTKMQVTVNDLAITLLGIIYIVGLIAFIALINGQDNGKLYIWYILFASWGTDIFAYIIGKKFGKHKFSAISPKKTIEGCFAGIIGSVVMILIYTIVINNVYSLNISYIYITIVAIILSIIGQIGDLSASTIKRFVGIKDFSNLIPGHGGIIDRIDSVMFIAPFVYLFLVLIGNGI